MFRVEKWSEPESNRLIPVKAPAELPVQLDTVFSVRFENK